MSWSAKREPKWEVRGVALSSAARKLWAKAQRQRGMGKGRGYRLGDKR